MLEWTKKEEHCNEYKTDATVMPSEFWKQTPRRQWRIRWSKISKEWMQHWERGNINKKYNRIQKECEWMQ